MDERQAIRRRRQPGNRREQSKPAYRPCRELQRLGWNELLRGRALRLWQQGDVGLRLRVGRESAQALEGFAARSLYRGRIPRRSRQAEGQDRDRAEAGGANAAERDDRAGAAWRSRARCRARRRRAGHSRAGGGASCRAAASSAYGNRSGSDPSYAAAGSAAGAGGFFNADTYQEAKTSVRDSG